jgi:hypothetical protein
VTYRSQRTEGLLYLQINCMLYVPRASFDHEAVVVTLRWLPEMSVPEPHHGARRSCVQRVTPTKCSYQLM